MKLTEIIKEQTEILFWNVQNSIDTVPDDKMSTILYDAPVWWYIYHNLHSLDKWFINSSEYEETISDERELLKEELTGYFDEIKKKIYSYLDKLTDDMLSEKPENSEYTRMTLILGQFRHAMVHVGILSGAMIYEIGKFPKYFGLDSRTLLEDKSKYY